MEKGKRLEMEEFDDAWKFQSRNALLSRLKNESRVLKSDSLERAFETIDRADFVLGDYKVEAYEDYPLPIGFDQTISQPTTVAFMLEKLEVEEGQNVLDLGCGSGWTSALLGCLVGESGKVFGVELIPELVKFGQQNIKKTSLKNVKINHAEELGLPKRGPFDRILVSAAAEEVPQVFVDQLANGGRMIIPVKNSIFLVKKSSNKSVETEEFPGFAFVPLVQ